MSNEAHVSVTIQTSSESVPVVPGWLGEVVLLAGRTNGICERFLGSVRRECLDQLLILHEKQLQRVLNAYVCYFNRARPHQGIKQQIPERSAGSVQEDHTRGKVIAFPILGGLYHDYHRSA